MRLDGETRRMDWLPPVNESDVLVASDVLPLRYKGPSEFTPGYVQYALPVAPVQGPLRVEVAPNSDDESLWAFITVTNPATSEVTPIFAH